MQRKLRLNGTIPVMIGIIIMLLPLELIFKTEGVILDLIGYSLMAVGLLILNKKDGGFKFATIVALISAALCAVMLLVKVNHLFALLPLCAFCIMLYFMCTRYALLAHRTGDEHMEHHFISHMWIDIVVTAIEILAHASGVEGLPYYIIMAVDLYCESMLLILMWQFYKKYDGSTYTSNKSPL
ncbi:MAG: hypothetical protein ACI4IW_00060 [Oscillospiraceae bacterium]